MNPLLKDMAGLLIDNGHATELNKDIFCDYVPEEPDDIVVLYEYDAVSSPDMGNSAIARYVQVVTRAFQQSVAKEKCWRLYNFLNEQRCNGDSFIHFDDGRWVILELRSAPLKTEVDEKQRVLYTFNIALTTNGD